MWQETLTAIANLPPRASTDAPLDPRATRSESGSGGSVVLENRFRVQIQRYDLTPVVSPD
jgi:hypothetical protein